MNSNELTDYCFFNNSDRYHFFGDILIVDFYTLESNLRYKNDYVL